MGTPPRVRVMRSVWGIVCVAVLALAAAGAGDARADDPAAATAKHKTAARLRAQGDYAEALRAIDEGLAVAPGHLLLLQLRGAILFEMRDYEAALAAYEAFLAAGPRGANKRAAQRIIANLAAVRTTSLDLTITGATPEDPASVYLDTKSLGVFCVAAPRCTRGLLPGDYKIIVERPGHKKLSERITVTLGQAFTAERALAERPSAVTIGVTAPDGVAPTIVLDGAPLGAPPQEITVEPGEHALEVSAAGHATERRTLVAHRGEPIEVAVTLRPLVPIAINAADAEVLIGDAPAPREADALVLPDGAVTLTVRAPRYKPQTIDVPADRPPGYRVDVTLAPAPAPVTVDGAPPGAVVKIDGRVAGTVPLAAPVELERGDHTVEVAAPGRAPFRTRVQVDSDAPLRVEVDRMPSTRRTWVWVAAAGTGAALVSWGAFGALALQREDDFDARAREAGVTPIDPTLMTLADEGDTFALLSDVSLGLTLAGAGVATWLFLTEGRAEAAGRVTPIVGPGAVGVQGSF